MIRTLAFLCAALGLMGSAFAADLPTAPPRAAAVYVPPPLPIYNWSGFYVGVNGGWRWSNAKFTFTDTANPNGLSGTPNGSGGVAGGTAGVNWQTGGLVFGVEVIGRG
ncbi:MAG: hypothetical protein WAK55_00060 [Xanthobacteraceae bacterium]